MISDSVKALIRDVPDFPKPGIVFKDITPIFQDSLLCNQIADSIVEAFKETKIDAVAGIDARGFIFGMLLSYKLKVPFVPIRKGGKLPHKTHSQEYDLEYGSATLEIHQDALKKDMNVLVHDDLLATGGTAEAAAKIVSQVANVVGFSFLVILNDLNGVEKLKQFTPNIKSVVEY